ncbi:class I SAM-dependent methyltransferase [Pseudoflavitalea sp. X16]|uniref:class I SAM-dependent methyltransferase n=1 Tax=Paraflavitalea devenefica TaxID=2716334 RepID=UPI0014202A7F|nr:class I SAM-dependent methyltransferase [Paraflavitalea devenefica]NII23508.1 class I SAM-dependent methyltransferase [Paraflavitalea devenefica]
MAEHRKEFSNNYFDSGEHKVGEYSSYEAERFYPAFISMVTEIQKRFPGKKILDLGCAKGFLVDVLRQNGYDAYGTDISEYAIKSCPPGLTPFLQVCDLNTDRIPFPDSFFDIIVCMGTLEYVENQEHALQEINRILKPGGAFLMTTLNSVTREDELRKYARKEEDWQATFAKLGYSSKKELAVKVFTGYVKKITEYDFARSLSDPKNSNLKMKIAGLFFKTIGKGMIVQYLLNKQLQSGYLMLGYIRQ